MKYQLLKKSKSFWVTISVSLLLVTSLIKHYQTSQEMYKYEAYISKTITDYVSKVADASYENRPILNKLLKSHTLTKHDALELNLNYRDISSSLQDLSLSMDYYLDRLKIERNLFVQVNYEIYSYFGSKYRNMLSEEKSEITLTKEDLNNIKLIIELNEKYMSTIDQKVSSANENEVKFSQMSEIYDDGHMLESGDWINLIEKFDEITTSEYFISY